MRGVEPPYSAWEADVLPMNYTCIRHDYSITKGKNQVNFSAVSDRVRYIYHIVSAAAGHSYNAPKTPCLQAAGRQNHNHRPRRRYSVSKNHFGTPRRPPLTRGLDFCAAKRLGERVSLLVSLPPSSPYGESTSLARGRLYTASVRGRLIAAPTIN